MNEEEIRNYLLQRIEARQPTLGQARQQARQQAEAMAEHPPQEKNNSWVEIRALKIKQNALTAALIETLPELLAENNRRLLEQINHGPPLSGG